MINTIRSSKTALTYKEVSDLVTERNYGSILEEAGKRSPDLSFDSAITKCNKSSRKAPPKEAELNEVQARAVENYRRRIYDSWSVLRASNIIVKVDSKRFRYNSEILEGGQKNGHDDGDTISADRLRRILESLNSMEAPVRNHSVHNHRDSN